MDVLLGSFHKFLEQLLFQNTNTLVILKIQTDIFLEHRWKPPDR